MSEIPIISSKSPILSIEDEFNKMGIIEDNDRIKYMKKWLDESKKKTADDIFSPFNKEKK
jgi:hypothetical protein